MYLYFTAPWCQPCKTLGPIMDDIAATGVEVIKVDVEQDPALVQTYGVMSIPTVIAVRAGQEVSRFTGGRDRAFVERFIQST